MNDKTVLKTNNNYGYVQFFTTLFSTRKDEYKNARAFKYLHCSSVRKFTSYREKTA